MRDWQVYNMRTCAPPVVIRVIPENEIPPAIAGGLLLKMLMKRNNYAIKC